MEYIVSQILGFVVILFVIASMQAKNMKWVLLCQIGCNALGMLSYVLIGGFSGCGIYLVATIQSILFFFIRTSGKQEPRWLCPLIICAYLACSLLAFETWLDAVPMAAAVLCAVSMVQKKTVNYRIIMLLNGTVWSVYDICLDTYTMLASHIITVVAALWGMIRLDIIPKIKEKNRLG